MKFSRVLILLTMFSASLYFAGCAKTLSVTEITQAPQGTVFYLAHNIWYEKPSSISSINYQTGHILPLGTPVEILKVTRRSVTFKDVTTQKRYTIKYEVQYALKPVDEYIRELFTSRDFSELTKGVQPEFIDNIRDGKVVKGMTKKEVLLAFGPPSPHKTPSLENQTWIYWTSRWPLSSTFRVIFKGDKVLEVLK